MEPRPPDLDRDRDLASADDLPAIANAAREALDRASSAQGAVDEAAGAQTSADTSRRGWGRLRRSREDVNEAAGVPAPPVWIPLAVVGYKMVLLRPSEELLETAMTNDGRSWYRYHETAFNPEADWKEGSRLGLGP